jgi:hypothetical protein
VDITIGTEHGLARLGAGGDVEWLLEGDVSVIDRRWAVVDGKEVVAVDDVRHVIPAPLAALCFASSPSRLLIGTPEAHLLDVAEGSTEAAVIESFDRIPTRNEWYTPWGAPPDTRSIAIAQDGTALVNVHVGGVWRDEGDGTWREVVDVDSDTHQVLAADDGSDVIVIAAAIGFGASTDGGRTFSWTADGLHDTYCRAVAVAGDVVLVSASTGPFTRNAAVYVRALDSTDPFVRCDDGLPEWFDSNIDTFQLAARHTAVAIGTGAGQVFVSQDAGASWDLAADGLGAVRSVAVG